MLSARVTRSMQTEIRRLEKRRDTLQSDLEAIQDALENVQKQIDALVSIAGEPKEETPTP